MKPKKTYNQGKIDGTNEERERIMKLVEELTKNEDCICNVCDIIKKIKNKL